MINEAQRLQLFGGFGLTTFRNDLQNGIYGNFIYIKDLRRVTGGQIQ
jgi:hypothetical protein